MEDKQEKPKITYSGGIKYQIAVQVVTSIYFRGQKIEWMVSSTPPK